MHLVITISAGDFGLYVVSAAAGRRQCLSPDELVAFLLRAGRPSVRTDDGRVVPFLNWAHECGLVGSVRLGHGATA